MTAPAPRRIQLRRTKGWRMPPDTVKVDRTTRYGNPVRVERKRGQQWNESARCWDQIWECRRLDEIQGQTFAAKATAALRAAIRFECEVIPELDLEPLRGKNIACWCGLDEPCHGDVYLDHANRPLPAAQET